MTDLCFAVDAPRCPVSGLEDECGCPPVKTPATWSQAFQTDLSRCPDEVRKIAVGTTIRTAREAGIGVRHRAQGWSTVHKGEVINWWPAQVNLFADYVARAAAMQRHPAGKGLAQ